MVSEVSPADMRFENNEWRPVLDTTLLEMDHMVILSQPKTKRYHFLAETRLKALEQKRIDKKLEWLNKLDSLDDGFIEWSANLDFEEYQKSWTEIATTRAVGE
jgi:hypothetical protein